MKNIKEKEYLIKMSLAMGVEPDPKIVREVEEYRKLTTEIKSKSSEIDDLFSQISNLKTQIDTVSDVVEVQELEEQKIIEVQQKINIEKTNIPLPPTLEEVLEKLNIKEEFIVEAPETLVDRVSRQIEKESKIEENSIVKEEVSLDTVISELKRKVKFLENWLTKISSTGPGGGEVNLLKLDDVDTTNIGNNKYLRYNSSTQKIEFATVSGGVGGAVDSVNGEIGDVLLTTANISEQSNLYFTNARAIQAVSNSITTSSVSEGSNLYFTNSRSIASLIAGTNIRIESNGRISSTATNGGGGGSVDLTSVSSNIIPDADGIYNLGSPEFRFKTLFLANNTIDLGGAQIKSDGTGLITISSSGAVLPVNSKVAVGEIERPIALLSEQGAAVISVPFYTQSSGLNTPATLFSFGINPVDYVFTNFTLNTGQPLDQSSRVAQFYF